MLLKRIAAVLLFTYSIAVFGYYIHSTINQEPIRRVFTKKELSDGPLVLKEGILVSGKNRVLKATVLENDIDDYAIIEPEPENATAPVVHELVLQQFVNTAQRVSDNGDNLLYFTFSNAAFSKLTLNWLCNTAEMKPIHAQLLIVGTTKEVCEEIDREWPKVTCFDLKLDGIDDSSEWGSKKYSNILSIRAQLMLALAEKNITFLLFETDAVWLRNPHDFFENQTLIEDADIVVPLKGSSEKGDNLSFNPMLAYPTNATRLLFKRIVDDMKVTPKLYDQDILNELCHRQFYGLVCREFIWEDVADGKWFKLSDAERSEVRPYVVNNNFYVGVQNKESRQAINGLWFLMKSGHCLQIKVRRALQRFAS